MEVLVIGILLFLTVSLYRYREICPRDTGLGAFGPRPSLEIKGILTIMGQTDLPTWLHGTKIMQWLYSMLLIGPQSLIRSHEVILLKIGFHRTEEN